MKHHDDAYAPFKILSCYTPLPMANWAKIIAARREGPRQDFEKKHKLEYNSVSEGPKKCNQDSIRSQSRIIFYLRTMKINGLIEFEIVC